MKKFLLIAVVLGLLVGCFVPEEYTLKMKVNEDQSYSIVFSGIMTYMPLLEIHSGDGLSESDNADGEYFAELFMDFDYVTKAEYIGDARFKVMVDTGVITEDYFMNFGSGAFFTVVNQGGTITVKSESLTAGDAEYMVELGMKIDGEIEIETAMAIANSNSDDIRERGSKSSVSWNFDDLAASDVFLVLQ
jgi:hypothetical protein